MVGRRGVPLLFRSNTPVGSTVSTSVCWFVVSDPTTVWTIADWDYRDIWNNWASTQWGVLTTSGITWDQMSGQVFVNVSTPTTIWTVVPFPTLSCP